MPQTIKNPLRILFLGAPNSSILTLLHSLTGSAPTPLDDSTAGLSHTWHVKTAYYEATLPIWIDEIASLEAWRADFLRLEAKEVVRAVGAVVYCFRKPVREEELRGIEDTMRALKEVLERHWGYGWEGTCLAVAMPNSVVPGLDKTGDEWEDLCREQVFEFVDFEGKGKNEFGELQGVERVKEALEACEWEALPENFDDQEEGGKEFGETFAAEEAEINLEWLGVKTAVNAGDMDEDEEGVEELERMMRKLQAIKGTRSRLCCFDWS